MENPCNPLLQGDHGALKRALYKSMGFDDEALSRPLIAVVNSYTTATPGHANLNELSRQVHMGIEAAGGTAMEFGTIAPCDGIAEGHEGMRYILPARDLIASSIECMVRAHRFDGMVMLGSCDKIVPGMLMAAARLDIPALLVNGGPMLPASYRGKHYDGNIVTESIGWKQRGEIDEAQFAAIENLAEPCVGSCAMLGTANTMGCMAEALGLMLPGTATIPAVMARRLRAARQSGRRVVEMVKAGLTARRVLTHEAVENAMMLLMAMGGSTNAIMHLQAIHREAGLGELPLPAFDAMSQRVPQVASIYPASPYDMADFDEAGGVPAILRELRTLLHADCLTGSGETWAELLAHTPQSPRREVIRPLAEPFAQTGGVAVLTGNLAPLGAVVKPAAVPEQLHRFEGVARVFQGEREACEAILAGQIAPGTAIVLRYEGPKGGPGMPEMYRPMKCLEGMGRAQDCCIVTDGRFSGSNRGLFIGHISPEAYEGGVLALIEDGDRIRVDIGAREVTLLVDEQTLSERAAHFVRPEKTVADGYLSTYRKNSLSAAQGAVVR